MPATVLVGCQWGDEGKGKIVDVLAPQSDIIARYQGGSNAGHTVIIGDKKYVFHLLPSGVLHDGVLNVIGNGVVVDVLQLAREIDGLAADGVSLDGRLLLSEQAHIILPVHKALDVAMEKIRGAGKIGTTGRGIGTAYADKARRVGLRLGDLRHPDTFAAKFRELAAFHGRVLETLETAPPDVEATLEEVMAVRARLAPLVTDTVALLNDALDRGKEILCEGAQGVMLDIDHGTYPFVTSSSPTPGGACTGLGLSPFAIKRVIGIVKAYTTRVGEGPMPTELFGVEGETLRKAGNEFGATTGRARRCGWLDLPVLRRSLQITGATELVITKLDVLDQYPELQVCTEYDTPTGPTPLFPLDLEYVRQAKAVYQSRPGWQSQTSHVRDKADLPETAIDYLNAISESLDTPISYVSTGPARDATFAYS